jgi:hypothetical protein
MNSENLKIIFATNVPEMILQNAFSYGTNPSSWSSTDREGIIFRVYLFLLNSSSIAPGSKYLKEYFANNPNYSSHFIQLLKSPTMIGILSTIVIAKVYGRDEDNQPTKRYLVLIRIFYLL